MHLIYMNADAHDIHTAYISHISHITSYALANTVLEKEREEDTISNWQVLVFEYGSFGKISSRNVGSLSSNKTKKMC